jgi:hypothetical protein
MIDRSDSADMIEPTEAAEPIENADSADPTEPIDRIEPTEPIDRIDPLQPMHRIEFSDRIDHRDRQGDTTPAILARGGRQANRRVRVDPGRRGDVSARAHDCSGSLCRALRHRLDRRLTPS